MWRKKVALQICDLHLLMVSYGKAQINQLSRGYPGPNWVLGGRGIYNDSVRIHIQENKEDVNDFNI